ncbi:MAG: GtrA family protein [Alphaproteobacteria bacterium]|nr:GtrA family protein [Alphaproteobacteria bacterium]
MSPEGFKSGLWFGLVGLSAAAVQTGVFAALRTAIWPELANALGFAVAFGVSFLGHRRLSFSDTTLAPQQSLKRFVITALLGFAANELSFTMMWRCFEWPSLLSLWLAMGVAAAQTFVLGRYWAFAR